MHALSSQCTGLLRGSDQAGPKGTFVGRRITMSFSVRCVCVALLAAFVIKINCVQLVRR
jgi:hypothetical protein